VNLFRLFGCSKMSTLAEYRTSISDTGGDGRQAGALRSSRKADR